MIGSPRELSISLEHLDDHLKAILKLKLREFVHLSPWFHDIPSIDVTFYPQVGGSQRSGAGHREQVGHHRHEPSLFKRRCAHVAVR